MKESDWKLLSKLKPLAVERLYDRIFHDVQGAVAARGKTSRELVHDTKRVVDRGIKEVSAIFDSLNFSRTHADTHLMSMCSANLLTEQELSGFSEETQERLRQWFGPDDE